MVSGTATLVLFCGTCRQESPFEQPECLDGHGSGCPEWSCLDCGAAVVVGFDVVEREPRAAAARRVA